MIKLYQFAPAWGIPNVSPFCVKTETYLRMANLPYEKHNALPPQAPKGKLPFIDDNGTKIADSRFIIEYLKETYGDTLDQHLNASQRAISVAMQRMIEDDLYWAKMYARWGKSDANWRENKRAIFGMIPAGIRDLVAAYERRLIRKQIWGQGLGRHSEDEIYRVGQQELTALSDFLGEKPYFMGNKPTTLDASAFGILVNLLWCPIESPLKEHAKTLNNLSAFCNRVKQAYYSESEVENK
ncbi:MAG: glutathione S-transferase family protein [Gammaproteobacteria bacterium]